MIDWGDGEQGEATLPARHFYLADGDFIVTISAHESGGSVVYVHTVKANHVPDRFAGKEPGEEWSENELKIAFCWCPPGKFKMGGGRPTRGQGGLVIDDGASVDVTLSRGFWMGKHELTQAQWLAVTRRRTWQGNSGVKDGPAFPASPITWTEAMAFCAQLTTAERSTGQLPKNWAYTLPTEAQWEYACRAGSKTTYSFGDDPADAHDYGWFSDGLRAAEQWAHALGQKKPNAWGLHDMLGNVSEWTRDRHRAPLPGGLDPAIVADPDEPGVLCVRRGGSWRFPVRPTAARSADRPDLRLSELGFRLAIVRLSE